jgi:cytochrome b
LAWLRYRPILTDEEAVRMLEKVRIWDLPTRLFHWALVLCLVFSVVTAKIGGNAMQWHMRSGCTVLALLAFRILWGVVGGRWSRFSSFIYGPAALLRYLRRRPPLPGEQFEAGHNPLGALSIWAMLLWLLLQIASGLVADDEIATTGPLNRFVAEHTAAVATGYHTTLGQWGLYVLTAMHVGAIVYYARRRGRDLLTPMFSGDKRLAADVPSTTDSWATRLFALTLLGACAAAVYLLVSLGDG